MKIGEPFNPYKLFNGVYLPFSLLEIKELSAEAKIAYGRLTAYAGKNGRAFPKQETWADALGFKSRTPLKRAIKELKAFGLIRVVKPSGNEIVKHKNDEYEFLWHEKLAESLKISPMDDSSHPDGQFQPPTMDDSSHRIYEEKNHVNKNHINTPISPDKIVNAYHDYLPELVKVKVLSEKRLASLKTLIKKYPKAASLDWWVDYFEAAAQMPYLHGRNHSGWKADFEWLIKYDNMIKVIEGRYDR